MMELWFYMASTCFATQIVSINWLNKRALFCQVEKNTYIYSLWNCDDSWNLRNSDGSSSATQSTVRICKTIFNKGYNYPMICALVKFNFRYEFELLHKKSPLGSENYGLMLILTNVTMERPASRF